MTDLKSFPAWQTMWIIAGLLFAFVKATTLPGPNSPRGWLALLYTIAWPGMDPAPFAQRETPEPVSAPRWFWAIGKTAFGAALIWLAARHLPPLAAGWCGMVGLILLLHCGSFELLALVYRCAGILVEPIMRNPPAARSLAEFWGVRWNRGFRDWAHRWLFLPAERRLGPAWAALWTYLVSGLFHELVITVPAGGGYGGPTAYFLLQGAGALAERTPHARRWLRGRCFALLLVAGPLGWLFPPLFVHRVMLPFLHALHAL